MGPNKANYKAVQFDEFSDDSYAKEDIKILIDWYLKDTPENSRESWQKFTIEVSAKFLQNFLSDKKRWDEQVCA